MKFEVCFLIYQWDLIWFELKQNGISDKLLHLIKNFRSDRIKRFVLNGQYFSWIDGQADIPQGSILGSLIKQNFLKVPCLDP